MTHRIVRSWLGMALLATATLGGLRISSAATPPATQPDLQQGKQLFQTHCASCHGPAGEGGRGPTLAQPHLPRASDDASLERIIRDGIAGSEMPGGRLENNDVPIVAKFVKSLGAGRKPEHVNGDPKRGQEIYAKSQCDKCHTIHGQGGSFGPDLSDVGLRRSVAYLRRSILQPDADVPQSFSARTESGMPNNFLYVRLKTRDGQEFSGVRVNEDTFSIQIRDVPGKVRSFDKSDLAELHKDWGKSPMPTYDGALRADEVDDLVAYLVSLRE